MVCDKKGHGLDHGCCEEYGQSRGHRKPEGEGLLQGKKPLVTQGGVTVF